MPIGRGLITGLVGGVSFPGGAGARSGDGGDFNGTGPVTVTDAAGRVYQFAGAGQGNLIGSQIDHWGVLAGTITDRNGNQLKLTGAPAATANGCIDTLGRTVVSWSGLGSGTGDTITVAGLANPITVQWTGVTSSRVLERATWEQIPFRYLAADQHPDHDTLVHFRRQHRDALGGPVCAGPAFVPEGGTDEAGQRRHRRHQDAGQRQHQPLVICDLLANTKSALNRRAGSRRGRCAVREARRGVWPPEQ